MSGWSPKDVTLAATGTVYGATLTDTPISLPYPITAGGALNCVLKIKTSAATVATGITAKLQTGLGGDWVDSKTVAITAGAGKFYIKLQAPVAGDQAFLPLLGAGRVVVTTGAGDSVTVTSVEVLQEL